MNRKGKKITLIAGAGVFAVVLLAGIYRRELAAWAKFVYRFESLGPNAQGYPEYRHRRTGIVMVRVPGGRFTMGSPEGIGEPNEYPQHLVELSPFLMAKFEVSRTEWRRMMGRLPPDSSVEGVSLRDWDSGKDSGQLPKEGISWYDCLEFCKRTGLQLPTEAQWEYACRAGTETHFSFGDAVDMSQINCRAFDGAVPVGFTIFEKVPMGETRSRVVPVDALEPNPLGIFHMHGNVSEWCLDVFSQVYYSSSEAVTKDPCLKSESDSKVARGGNWDDPAIACRSAYRGRHHAGVRSSTIGFRPAYFPLP